MDESLRELVLAHAPVQLIRDRASERGVRSLRQEGLRAVSEGLTTLEEIAKYL